MSLYLRPKTLKEATSVIAETPGAVVLSGGTDFYPSLAGRPMAFPVIDISSIEEISGITMTPDEILIGGRTTWSAIAAAKLPRALECLQAAAREIGSVQIQNCATIAGNLCNASPAADSVPCLLALDAEITLASAAGNRRMPLGDFILGNRKTLRRPDELLSTISIPRKMDDAASVFLKLGARRYMVISIAMVAAILLRDEKGEVAQARLAVGSCSVRAQRLLELEQDLVGAPASAALARIATAGHLAGLSPIDDVRATGQYRREAALVLVKRALAACAEKAQ